MRVLAKFRCSYFRDADYTPDHKKLRMQAVTTGSEENKSFSKWTPAANLEMLISKETPASEFFEENKEYYLTFQEADYPLEIK